MPLSPQKSRRATTRRSAAVPDADFISSAEQLKVSDAVENIPSPTHSPKRRTRRTVIGVPPSSKSVARPTHSTTDENIERPETFHAGSATPRQTASPSKRPPSRKSNSSGTTIDSTLALSSSSKSLPAAPLSPADVSRSHDVPLADITNSTINEQSSVRENEHKLSSVVSLDTVLEKPMDIVVRTRALGVPRTLEHSPPESRTVIKHLVLTNFKSYAGRQVVGPFHASFSSVVGPNGSGKSNVIDSLLFVFGFRASKMRQGKISALIHNSAAFPDLNHCEVEVHFQEVRDLPGGTHEVVPDSDLIISRKAFKNNSSKYYLNARESNFTAVTTLLKDKGVDLDHKRFLILQGEVESIAQMKPKAANEHDDGLLEYLEDIIGTSKYKGSIEESAAEVETLNEVCLEKSVRVKHVEKERNGLEDKKNKALSFLQNENELTYKQSALYQVYVEECNDNLKVTSEAIRQIELEYKEELDKHQGSEDQIKMLEKSFKKGQKDYEFLETETHAVLKEMARFEKEKVKQDEKRKFLLGKQTKLEKALQSSRLSASESESLVQKFTDDIERGTLEISSLEELMRSEEHQLAEIRDSLKGRTQEFSDGIALKQKQLEPWCEKINQKQSAIAVAESELEMLRERSSAGEVALRELKIKIEAAKGARVTKNAEIERLKAIKTQYEVELDATRAAISTLNDDECSLRSQLSTARQKADEARASLSASQSQGQVLSGLLRLKQSGRIEGFHGRLGNLGTIDSKYDVAISTACPALGNLVVDSVEVGQQCIDYLRKNNLGRASIILLDRLARRDMSMVETPEGVPRLIDLVETKEERFRPAFYSVLQNTLVASDLEQANRIAYGARRWRVVTLDGQLIDVSGAMSGGGSRVVKGGMSSKMVTEATKEQVSELETSRDTIEDRLRTVQEEKTSLESRLRELLGSIPATETQIQKQELDLSSLDRNTSDLERRVVEIDAESQTSKSDGKQVALLEKQIQQLREELGKLQEASSGLEQEIKMLQERIMEVGGVKLRSQKAKVEGLKEQISTLNEEISNAEVSKARSTKDKAKHEKVYRQTEENLKLAADELSGLDSESSGWTAEAAESRRKAEKAREALEEKKEELDMMKTELANKTAELNETRGSEIEMRNKLDENQKVFAENEKRLRYWTEKLEKLALQSVREFSDIQGEVQEDEEQLPTYTKDELLDMDKNTLKAEIAILEEKTQNTNVDLSVLDEYRRRVEEHSSRSSDLQTALSARDTAKKRYDDLRRLRLEGFMEGFSTISLRLKEMYQMITMGGNAELELVDSLDPFSEGILFSVMPPKKSWKNISNLSGGEKTLSSLALVFALHHYKPTPLYVMDEIDAALDFRNVSIVASYIKERTKNAQFIVISLRNNMFELASRLVGVYKVNQMTKSVTVENKDYTARRP